jgi:hypothetical protein
VDPAFHFDADPDPDSAFHSDADPAPTFNLMRIRIPHTFAPELYPPLLQIDPVRRPPFHFDADPDPAFHFDADPDPTFLSDADTDPAPAPTFNLMWIRTLPFTLMRIRILLLI